MGIETSFTHARANLASLCDEVTSTREPILIRRRGSEDVALVAAAELRGLMETAHLLRSPKNAQRLLTALAHALSRDAPKKQTKGCNATPSPVLQRNRSVASGRSHGFSRRRRRLTFAVGL